MTCISISAETRAGIAAPNAPAAVPSTATTIAASTWKAVATKTEGKFFISQSVPRWVWENGQTYWHPSFRNPPSPKTAHPCLLFYFITYCKRRWFPGKRIPHLYSTSTSTHLTVISTITLAIGWVGTWQKLFSILTYHIIRLFSHPTDHGLQLRMQSTFLRFWGVNTGK